MIDTPKQPATEAGRALLRSDFDTTGWGPTIVRKHVTEAVFAIEAEAGDAAGLREEINALDHQNAELGMGLLALREALIEGADFAKQTLIDLPDERATRNVIAHLYRVLADTAPAAAEIEARIGADERSKAERDAARLIAALVEAAGGEIRVPMRLQISDVYLVDEPQELGNVRVYRTREQPAADEATEYTDEQFVAELRADGEHELADGVERALRAEVRRIAYLADDIERRRQADALALPDEG